MRWAVQLLLNAVGLLVAAHLVPGISYQGGLLSLLLAGLVIGLLNLSVKPLVVLLSLPFIVATLGLFFLVVNGLVLGLAAALLPSLTIDGCLPALLGGVVMTVFNWAVAAVGATEE